MRVVRWLPTHARSMRADFSFNRQASINRQLLWFAVGWLVTGNPYREYKA
jgi:hypothetical protein